MAAASRADWGANEGAALLFTGSRSRRRAAAAAAAAGSGTRLFSAAAATGGAAAGGEGDAAAVAAAAAAKLMAEVNAGMKEALPQLNSVLSKKVRACVAAVFCSNMGREKPHRHFPCVNLTHHTHQPTTP